MNGHILNASYAIFIICDLSLIVLNLYLPLSDVSLTVSCEEYSLCHADGWLANEILPIKYSGIWLPKCVLFSALR